MCAYMHSFASLMVWKDILFWIISEIIHTNKKMCFLCSLNYHPQPFPAAVAPVLYNHLYPSWATSPVDKPTTPMMSSIDYHGTTCIPNIPRSDHHSDTTRAQHQVTTNTSTPIKSSSHSEILPQTPLTLYQLLNDTPRTVSQNAAPYISQMTSATPFLGRSCFSSPMYGYSSQFNYHLRWVHISDNCIY